jgi:hypothetical protein
VVVPSIAGVHFTLEGVRGVTGPGGSATVVVPQLRDAARQLVVPGQQLGSNLRVSLDRVANDPDHGVFSRRLVAELDEDRAVTIQPITPERDPVPIAQVSSVTMTSSLGRTVRLDGAQLRGPIWLAASRPARLSAGVGGRSVTYAIDSVVVRGANVVNSGQIRFDPKQSSVWTVPSLFYTLTIQASDILAGGPAGSSVKLTYPDGAVMTVPLGARHRATIADLPRGTYHLEVNGGVWPLISTVRLSRSQTATQAVATVGDLVLVLVIGLSAVAVVVAAGALGRRRRRRAEIEQAGAGAVFA